MKLSQSERSLLTFGSWPSSEPAGLTSSARVCSQLPSRVRRKKLSPSKQSSARGSSFLLANGSGWQHQSSTRAFQFTLGRGRTRLNFLKEAKAITSDLIVTIKEHWGFVASEQASQNGHNKVSEPYWNPLGVYCIGLPKQSSSVWKWLKKNKLFRSFWCEKAIS